MAYILVASARPVKARSTERSRRRRTAFHPRGMPSAWYVCTSQARSPRTWFGRRARRVPPLGPPRSPLHAPTPPPALRHPARAGPARARVCAAPARRALALRGGADPSVPDGGRGPGPGAGRGRRGPPGTHVGDEPRAGRGRLDLGVRRLGCELERAVALERAGGPRLELPREPPGRGVGPERDVGRRVGGRSRDPALRR